MFRKLFKTKLTKKYFMFTLITLLITLFTVWWMVDLFSKVALRKEIENRDYLLNKALSQRFNQIFLDIESDLILYEAQFDKDNEFYVKRMENLVATKPWYLFINYFDKRGKLKARIPNLEYAENELPLKHILERVKWTRAPYVTDLITLPDGRKTIGVATPISRTSQSFEGAYVAFLNLNVLSDFLYQSSLGKKGFCILLDKKGHVIAHTDKNLIGEKIEGSIVSNLIKGKHGIWMGELFDQEIIASYYPVSYGNIGMIVGEPVSQAFLPTAKLSWFLIRCFIVVVGIAIALVYYGIDRIVQPINKLTQQAKSYSSGKINDFDKIETGDELAVLSETMHNMALRLIKKEKSLFQILESIPYAVITTDNKGVIKSFNKGAENLLKFSRNEVINRYLFDLKLKKKGDDLFFRRTLEKGEIVDEAETYVLDKNGEVHDVRLYCAPLFAQQDYNSGAIVVIRDVAELKKLQQHLYRSERLAALGQLTAGIAHEIKNPLNIISAAAEALQRRLKKHNDAETYEMELIANILDASNRMNKQLQDFLQLSKGNSGKLKPIDIVPVINELLYAMRNNFKARNITLQTEYDVQQAYIKGDKNRLTQAFLNIIINSMQAMKKGGTLTVALNEKNNYWYVYITDTGKGISKTHLQRIFNPFFSTKQTGTGLGLAIVHEIINQHNGHILVESEPGKGTTMICIFPKLDKGEG